MANRVLIFALVPVVVLPQEPSRTLFDFEGGFDPRLVRTTDAQVEVVKSGAGSGLRVGTGHTQNWPGITLPAPGKSWDLTAFDHISASVRNPGTNAVTVNCRVDNTGADGRQNCVTASVTLPAGQTRVLRVPLKRFGPGLLNGLLFGMRGYPATPGGEGTVDPTRITQLLFFVNQPKQVFQFELDDLQAAGRFVPPTALVSDADPYLPFIDTYGQYRHKDWPGKIHSDSELAAARAREELALEAQPGPAGWNRYGGWLQGPQLKATGFFRTEKVGSKWWLVDPEGRLFFSQGIDCVRMLDSTAVEGRLNWFDDFPGDKADLAEFKVSNAHALKGHYAGRNPLSYSFAGANLKRKYGPDWKRIYPEIIHRRLRSWGLNTIGNWSDASTVRLRRTAYTDSLDSSDVKPIQGSDGYWGKFIDPFDPGFAESLNRGMESKRGGSAGDPWCLGYFSDNEQSWGEELSLAQATLKSPPNQAAKQQFVADLKRRYGSIEKLNQSWNTAHASWETLLASREAPEGNGARADLEAFAVRIADEYFSKVRQAIKRVAPNQLYLGCRFAWVNRIAAASAARFCDVVSYNLYQRSVADFLFNGGADVPLMIGEFHFGALDRGLFHTGLVPVADQGERARAYADYVRGALGHPQFVGVHWFQYQDEPTTGRVWDEENYQIGFVDIADTPYNETITASRALANDLYRVRFGQ